jgi:predicted metal-dependent phosphoesterase TrpH
MTEIAGGVLRADLHVHSYYSGYASHLRFLRTRDCYSEPEAVYRVAKGRGMDVVTITDHDSIEGCLELLERHPDADDFFISEEVECHLPDTPVKLHVAAYGIDERIHREIQPLRQNAREAVAYLAGEGVFFALNHLFFLFDRQVPLQEYLRAVLPLFPAFEVRNGAMLREHNALIEEVLRD